MTFKGFLTPLRRALGWRMDSLDPHSGTALSRGPEAEFGRGPEADVGRGPEADVGPEADDCAEAGRCGNLTEPGAAPRKAKVGLFFNSGRLRC